MCSWGTDSCALARAAMLMRTARAQGSGKQGGGASSGSGSKPEWRSFNDKFLGLVRLHPLHHWGLSCHLCRSVHDREKNVGLATSAREHWACRQGAAQSRAILSLLHCRWRT